MPAERDEKSPSRESAWKPSGNVVKIVMVMAFGVGTSCVGTGCIGTDREDISSGGGGLGTRPGLI